MALMDDDGESSECACHVHVCDSVLAGNACLVCVEEQSGESVLFLVLVVPCILRYVDASLLVVVSVQMMIAKGTAVSRHLEGWADMRICVTGLAQA